MDLASTVKRPSISAPTSQPCTLRLGVPFVLHHRFPRSARHGLGPLELDPTWWGIRILAILRLVTDVRLPARSHPLLSTAKSS
jgi:hypothetical protein